MPTSSKAIDASRASPGNTSATGPGRTTVNREVGPGAVSTGRSLATLIPSATVGPPSPPSPAPPSAGSPARLAMRVVATLRFASVSMPMLKGKGTRTPLRTSIRPRSSRSNCAARCVSAAARSCPRKRATMSIALAALKSRNSNGTNSARTKLLSWTEAR